MPSDALAPLLIATTTANGSVTSTVGDFLTIPGSPRYGYVLRVRTPSYTVATAGLTFYYQLQQSADQTTWTNLFQSDTITPTTATTVSRLPDDLPFIMTKRYAQLVTAFSASTGTPVVVFAAELIPEFPG